MIHQRLITKGLKYYLTFPHYHGHGIHSPLILQIVNEVFAKDIDNEILHKIENYRQSILKETDYLHFSSYGSKASKTIAKRKISDIIKKESISSHYGKLLFRLIDGFHARNILELGTSLGISAFWMASASPSGKVYSLEGSPEKVRLVRQKMEESKISNIEIFEGNFDEQLSGVLHQIQKVDFVFIDGNHQKKPTLRYFNEILKFAHDGTIFVFDDILWSSEMVDAWIEIQKHSHARICLDLLRFGIIFVDPKLQKQRITIFY
jgi:predicted O-methyltransferase YrrM